MSNERLVNHIGWFASLMAMLMFSSYIDQIRLNIAGQTGSVLIPAATILNCVSWLLYGVLKPKKDWPIIACNILGITVATITLVTAFIY